MADLLDRDFKTTVLKMLKELKEHMVKVICVNRMELSNKEIENLKKNNKEILELKSTITKIKIHYRDSKAYLSRRKELANLKIK